MRKLKLNLDQLCVEAFQVTPQAGQPRQGTVVGYSPEERLTLDEVENTGYSCLGTCVQTCQAPPCPIETELGDDR